MTDDFEAMVAALEATGDYRILRRLPSRTILAEPNGAEQRLGVVLDFETTGLDPDADEIIEIAMVPFLYSPDGVIFEICKTYQRFRQPSKPITPEITALTGITDDAVRGCSIDPAEVADFVAPAVLIIAHHAAFDRPFAERFAPAFCDKHWACSMSEVDWKAEGAEGAKLVHLVQSLGFFYDSHRALSDCTALVELLARPLPRSGVSGLAKLLEAARQPTWRIWAENTPFARKDLLKARGYRWSGGEKGMRKAWYCDASEASREAEVAFLKGQIYMHDGWITIERQTSRDRFSDRGVA